jgi:hypothetical protein
MAVAAVDNLEQIAAFSSRGPSGDGRLKPDISAMGQGTFFARPDGAISAGSGTSFACPMMSGFAACLLQTEKGLGNMDLFDAIIRSGDRYVNPDTAYGHGIPNGPLAYEIIHGKTLPGTPGADQYNDFGVSLYPNPAWENLQLVIQNTEVSYAAELTLTDLAGRRIGVLPIQVGPFINRVQFNPQLAFPTISQGVYIVRLKNLSTSQYIFTGKVRINE